MNGFIDEHRARFGVEPICRVLSERGCPIAPRTCWAGRRRPLSVRDAALFVEVRRVHYASHGGLYGARKVYAQLPREGIIWS